MRPSAHNRRTGTIMMGTLFLNREGDLSVGPAVGRGSPGSGTGVRTDTLRSYPCGPRSGREDLNLRPHGPEPCALAGLRYAPIPVSLADAIIPQMPHLVKYGLSGCRPCAGVRRVPEDRVPAKGKSCPLVHSVLYWVARDHITQTPLLPAPTELFRRTSNDPEATSHDHRR